MFDVIPPKPALRKSGLAAVGRVQTFWAALPLRSKVLLAVSFPSLALLAMLFTAFVADREHDCANEKARLARTVQEQIDRADVQALMSHVFVNHYLVTGSLDAKRQAGEKLALLRADISRLRALVSRNPSQFSRFEEVQKASLDFSRKLNRVLAESQPGAPVAPHLWRDTKNSLDVLLARLKATSDEEARLLRERERNQLSTKSRAQFLQICCLAVGLAVGGFFVVMLIRSIVGRVLALQANVRRLQEGAPLEPLSPSHDEVGRLVAGFEKASRWLNERQLAFENAHDGIARFDTQGVATWANKAFASLFGCSAAEIIGRRAGFPVVPEDRHLFEAAYRASCENGKANTTLRVKRKDGAVLVVQATAVAVRNSSGEFSGHYTFLKDVTEHVEAQEAFRKAQPKLKSVLAGSAQVAIISTDLEGRVRLLSPGAASMLGYEASELMGRPVVELHDPDEISRRSAELAAEFGEPVEGFEVFVACARHSGFEEREWTYIRKDLARLTVTLTVTPTTDQSGRHDGYLAVALDTTQRKLTELRLLRAKEEAETANRAKSEFLARMSHEIRTPMNAILGMADLLWETELTPQQRGYVRIFRASADRLINLINDVLDLSKIEAGRLSFEKRPFLVREVLAQAIDLLIPQAVRKDIDLNYRVGTDIPEFVVGDGQRLQQVLLNLIGNAVKFTDQGEVAVEVRIDEQTPEAITLLFSVRDTGPGIPADHLETIFDPFVQADTSITRKHGGTGLGLAICRRLVDMMNGRIWAESGPEEGSCFLFTARFEPWEHGPDTSIHRTSLEGLEVLIVDGDPTNRLVLRETILRWGAHPSEAADAETALREVHRANIVAKPFDLVLLADRLGPASGLEAAENILKESSRLPAIALFTDRIEGDFAQAQALGIGAIAEKTLDRNRLFETIREALESREQHLKDEHHVFYDRKPRVLIAEDSEANMLLMKAYLEKEGVELEFVPNGRLALERYRARVHDLIFMDLQMPEMDGHTATREIRRWEREQGLPPAPIIALSAHALDEEIKRSREAGCTAHLAKPVRRKTILDVLHRRLCFTAVTMERAAPPQS